jgi:hypothetical protein
VNLIDLPPAFRCCTDFDNSKAQLSVNVINIARLEKLEAEVLVLKRMKNQAVIHKVPKISVQPTKVGVQ